MAIKFYKVSEIAAMFRVNKSVIYTILDAGLLPYNKVGVKKVEERDLLEFIEKYQGVDLSNPQEIERIKNERNQVI